MLLKIGQNLLALALCWLLTAAAGFYTTFIYQPRELERVKKAEQLARMKQAEVSSLLVEAAASKQKADQALARWRARYKVIPATLTSADVVGNLTRMTQYGFKNFDVTLDGVKNGTDYSIYTFGIQGKAYFGSLYRFVWDVENGRNLYRIRDLQVEHTDVTSKERGKDVERMQIMVSFTMKLEAYFGGRPGGAVGDSAAGVSAAVLQVLSAPAGPMPQIPAGILASSRPAVNPFFPAVLENLPPNTNGLLDVSTAKLVGIVGGRAIFQDEGGYRQLSVGDAVYLGRITMVRPTDGVVTIRMNQGGIVDQIEMRLDSGAPYRQAFGPARLTPAQ